MAVLLSKRFASHIFGIWNMWSRTPCASENKKVKKIEHYITVVTFKANKTWLNSPFRLSCLYIKKINEWRLHYLNDQKKHIGSKAHHRRAFENHKGRFLLANRRAQQLGLPRYENYLFQIQRYNILLLLCKSNLLYLRVIVYIHS